MILPPHILKYQKQLQELNKKSSSLNEISSSNQKKIEKEEPKIKGKNKPSNKFIHSKNSSFTNLNQSDINSKKEPISLSESNKEEEEEDSEDLNENMEEKNVENKKLSKREEKMKENWRIYRKGAGVIWQDESLNEWPENDYRIFVGDLGNEVNDQVLANAFIKYPSFAKAKVIRNKITGKTKGYGFVSVTDVNDYIKIMREMNGKYVGNRPIKIKRSTWKDRSVMYSKSKMQDATFLKKKRNKGETINLPELTDMKLLKKDPTLGGILNQIK
jgi:RNA recognition motif-containing protein